MQQLFTAFALVVLPIAAAAQTAPPAPAPPESAVSAAGAWNISSNIGGSPIEMQCTLTQKDADLTGNCTSQQQTQLPITGKVDGKKVTWQFSTVYDGQTLTVVYSGTLDSDKIVGDVDVQPMAVSGEFTATKVKPAA